MVVFSRFYELEGLLTCNDIRFKGLCVFITATKDINKYFTDKITHLFRRKCQTTKKGLKTPLSSKIDHFCKDMYEGKLFQMVYISVL